MLSGGWLGLLLLRKMRLPTLFIDLLFENSDIMAVGNRHLSARYACAEKKPSDALWMPVWMVYHFVWKRTMVIR